MCVNMAKKLNFSSRISTMYFSRIRISGDMPQKWERTNAWINTMGAKSRKQRIFWEENLKKGLISPEKRV